MSDEKKFEKECAVLNEIKSETAKVIVGQEMMIDRLLTALICGGHVLLEGVPGLAKTLTVSVLSQVIDADFKRIQFTPDLLPSDLLGTLIYNPQKGAFTTKKGPVFANIVLADEINRAPAKVQSALLECMQERQVTLGDETFALPKPFFVLATQNPIDQEGTFYETEHYLSESGRGASDFGVDESQRDAGCASRRGFGADVALVSNSAR